MIQQGNQQLQIQKQILTSKTSLRQKLLEKIDQKGLVHSINKNNQQLVQIYKKQIQTTNSQQYTSPNIMQIKNLIYPTTVYNTDSLINIETFDQKNYRSLSLMNIVQTIVIRQISKLIQMETQIDIFTKNLYVLPSIKKTIIQFITQFAKLTKIDQMFQSLFQAYKDSILQQQRNQIMLRPILQKTKQVLQYLRFQVSQTQAMQCLFDLNIQPLIANLQTVKQTQNQHLIKIRQKNKQLFLNLDFQKNLRQYVLTMLAKKKQSKFDQNFFSTQTPSNYQTLISKALQSQTIYAQNQLLIKNKL